MSAPEPMAPGIEGSEVQTQLFRILQSRVLRDADVLKRLLQFVVNRQLDGRGDEIKESTIALEVFDRQEYFDGRSDNSVRVSASRLRAKLTEYYEGEGAEDRIIIRVPRGAYVPSFELRTSPDTQTEEITAADSPPADVETTGITLESGHTVRLVPLWIWPSIAAALALFALGGYWLGTHSAEASLPPKIRAFWSRLWNRPTTLVFRNTTLLRYDDDDALLYLYYGNVSALVYERIPLPADVPASVRNKIGQRDVAFENTWTDLGAVTGTFAISRILSHVDMDLKVEGHTSMTVDRCRGRNLVMVSPPWGNSFLRQARLTREFEFDQANWVLLNKNPKPGELAVFQNEYATSPTSLRASYALIALTPGFSEGTRNLLVSGINSVSVSAASLYLTNEAGLSDLEVHFGGAIPEFFEVVLRVEFVRGEGSRTRIVALRKTDLPPIRSGADAPSR